MFFTVEYGKHREIRFRLHIFRFVVFSYQEEFFRGKEATDFETLENKLIQTP